jgi:hypothetical protein
MAIVKKGGDDLPFLLGFRLIRLNRSRMNCKSRFFNRKIPAAPAVSGFFIVFSDGGLVF